MGWESNLTTQIGDNLLAVRVLANAGLTNMDG